MPINLKHPLVLILTAVALIVIASKYMGEKTLKTLSSPVSLFLGAFLFIGALWKGGFFEKAKDLKSIKS